MAIVQRLIDLKQAFYLIRFLKFDIALAIEVLTILQQKLLFSICLYLVYKTQSGLTIRVTLLKPKSSIQTKPHFPIGIIFSRI